MIGTGNQDAVRLAKAGCHDRNDTCIGRQQGGVRRAQQHAHRTTRTINTPTVHDIGDIGTITPVRGTELA